MVADSPPPVLAAPTSPLTPPASTTPLPGSDLTLASAVAALVTHLVDPLAAAHPAPTLTALRASLAAQLTALYAPTWDPARPDAGSGYRSLICARPHGLPPVLAACAADAGIDEAAWRAAIAARADRGDDDDEWEAWCDPACVSWRWGPWEYDEPAYDPPRPKEYPQTVWSGAAPLELKPSTPARTPARPSHAIPIRAPAVLQVPPTPLASGTPSKLSTAPPSDAGPSPRAQSPATDLASLLPAAGLRPVSPTPSDASSTLSLAPSHASSATDSSGVHVNPVTPCTDAFALPGAHDRRGRTPSASSASSDSQSAAAPAAPAKPATPTVTPYDGGNVTVVGGGTKLGSAPPSSHSRASSLFGGARSRSPSVSASSRALANAVGANSNGAAAAAGSAAAAAGPRKPRTRRRIHPTYLGPFGQPGVGGPVPSAFGYAPKPIPYAGVAGVAGATPAAAPVWPAAAGVGVGVAPPPLHGIHMASQMGMRPQSLGMLRRA